MLPLLLVGGLLPFAAPPAAAAAATATTENVGSRTESTVSLTPGVPVVVDLADRPQLAFLVGSTPTEITVRTRANGWGTPEHADVPADAEATILWLGRATDALELTSDTPVTVRVTTVHVAEAEPTIRAMSLLDTGANGPAIRARADWATADRTWDWANPDCSDGPVERPFIEAVVIHHTGSGGAHLPLTELDVIAAIQGIYDYHVGSNGWCDIGYNVIVDAAGTIWEARTGGHDKAIQGAHASGYNWTTSGALGLGSFDTGESTPTTPMIEALGDYARWKLQVHGRSTSGPVTLEELAPATRPGYPIALYQTFIGVPPTNAQAATLQTRIDAIGRFEAALELARSDAWAGAMVDRLYRDVLGRPADPGGRAYWVGQMRNGLRFETAAVYFYGSTEYYLAAGNPSTYVTSLYQQLLGRAPDTSGLQFWSGLLTSGSSDPPGIVTGFYTSIESRLGRVRELYQSILLRDPDTPGHAYWAGQLLNVDDVVLAALLASSDEFYDRSPGDDEALTGVTVATERITYHGLLNATACPGEHMIDAIPAIRLRAATS